MRTIYEYDMLYSGEHFQCQNYQHDVTIGFRYREYPFGSVYTSEAIASNCIIFLLKGRIKFDYCTDHNNHIGAGNMLFLPIKTLCNLEFEEDSEIIILNFDKWDFSCSMAPFQSLRKLVKYVDNSSNVLPINHQLAEFLSLQRMYLRNGVSCTYLHRHKIEEFFILLRHFYSKEQIASFLAPILGKSQEFRMACLRMRATSRNITDMIAQVGMSKTKFYDEFRKEFGEVNPKSWFDGYLEYKILHEASKPDATVKQLTYQLEFDSEAAFSQYCHRHFGLTASELIRNRRKSIEAL
jgi:AraC-like DNA-binding protein